LEFEMEGGGSRKRRTAHEQKNCEMDSDGNVLPGQECCLARKHVDFQQLNFSNIISPMAASITWCSGSCSHSTSFKQLWEKYTSKIFDDGTNGERCCHATESEPVNLIFLSDEKEIKVERVFDIFAKKCSCS
ncbi:hypothetical protein PMAYCL1PPCAC_09000, partial [Pristionchus mayeri]